MEVYISCSEVLEKILLEVENRSLSESSRKKSITKFNFGRKELTWESRAIIIYYYLHPLLGNRDILAAVNLFGICWNTLKGWLHKNHFRKRWTNIVTHLVFEDVLEVLPFKKDTKSRIMRLTKNISPAVLQLHRNNTKEIALKPMKIRNKNSIDTIIQQCKSNNIQASKIFSPYIRCTSKRIPSQQFPKTTKNVEANSYIEDIVKSRWNMGLPINKLELAQMLLIKAKKDKLTDFLKCYGEGNEKSTKKLYIFIERGIRKAGFCQRKRTVSQKIPEDWRILAEAGAKRIRETFREQKVDIVLAADETFIRFHEIKSKVIAPKGEKRIGTASCIDEKSGCTVFPTMEMNASLILPPLIIFTGVFGATLMKQWKNYTKSLVLFTENHWMTGETFIIYLKWLLMNYKNKTIGLIVDYAPSHEKSDVDTWIKKINSASKTGSRIVIEWIDKGLTSVYQPGDIMINKPLKDHIRSAYCNHITSTVVDDFQPGQKIQISRKKLVQFIEEACAKINSEQGCSRSIYKSFKTCGLNPFSTDTDDFKKHLDELSYNMIYNKLERCNNALHL